MLIPDIFPHKKRKLWTWETDIYIRFLFHKQRHREERGADKQIYYVQRCQTQWTDRRSPFTQWRSWSDKNRSHRHLAESNTRGQFKDFKELQSTTRAQGVSEEIFSSLGRLRELRCDVTTVERSGVWCRVARAGVPVKYANHLKHL